MTGPEHYRKAEELLASGGRAGYPRSPERIAEAQVHATLALASAAALHEEPGDIRAWREATGQEDR